MKKSIIYAANAAAQTGSIIDFGNIVRKLGCNCGLSNGNLVASGCGYYKLNANITLTAGAGLVTIQAYKDGIEIVGAEASFTAAANIVYNVALPESVFKNVACQHYSTITVGITANTPVITNAAATLEKVGD